MKAQVKITFLLAMLLAQAAPAQAGNGNISGNLNGSELASVVVVLGSVALIDVSGTVVVESVSKVGDGLEVVLKGLSDGAKATLQLSGRVAEGFSVAVGSTVVLVATSTGHALMFAGKVLAFIPNEVGRSLLHHSAANQPAPLTPAQTHKNRAVKKAAPANSGAMANGGTAGSAAGITGASGEAR